MAPARTLRTARVSLTDRCDLACVYCRPASPTTRRISKRRAQLDLESWRVLLAALLKSGARTVRFTGGEPLLHPAVVDLVRMAAELGFSDIALTTNATRLERLAAPLRAAGLRRVNVSLDSLDRARFAQITRADVLDRVLGGIEAARAVGFVELKTNTVVMRGTNDDELERIVLWAWDRAIVPRFIELMPIGAGATLGDVAVHEGEMVSKLARLIEPGDARPEADRGPARYLRSRTNPAQRVGFITGCSRSFCDTCDRLRVTADGLLLPCLAIDDGVAAHGAAARGNVDLAAANIRAAWSLKPESGVGCLDPRARAVSMCGVGG
jgi:cyclic pyranopterin phosphate synthase